MTLLLLSFLVKKYAKPDSKISKLFQQIKSPLDLKRSIQFEW